MSSLPRIQVSSFDRLSDDILQCILDFAMFRDSPCFIDDPCPGVNRSIGSFVRRRARRSDLVTSTGAKDPDITGFRDGSPVHHRTLQPAHRKDWIAINSTCYRFRNFGKISFFTIKTFAMHGETPARLRANDPNAIKGMMLHDQALALSRIRDVIIVNQKQSSPLAFLEIPPKLAVFPSLRRCTLLFGFTSTFGSNKPGTGENSDDVEWITAAFVLGGPAPLELHELMVGIGMLPNIKLGEAMGPEMARNNDRRWTAWQDHRELMESDIYPILRIKAKMIRARQERERSLIAS